MNTGSDQQSVKNSYTPLEWQPRLLITLGWWILCGVLPLIALQWDFGRDGIFFAQLYSHFFLYPALIGFLIVLCLLPSVHLLRHFLGHKKFAILFLIICGLSVYGTLADVDAGDPALWEFKNVQVTKVPSTTLANAVDEAREVHKLCREKALLEATPTGSNCSQRQTNLLNTAKSLAAEASPRSLTHSAYVLSLFIQLATLVLAVTCVGSLVVYRDRLRGDLFSTDKTIAFTFFFYFLWVPLRLFAIKSKISIYGDATFVSELPITLIIFGCYLYSLRLTWTVSRDYTIHVMQFISAAALVYCAMSEPAIFSKIFGTTSTPFTYPLVTIVLLLLLSPWLFVVENTRTSKFRSLTHRLSEHQFLVALSFSGDRRVFVGEVTRHLKEKLGEDAIFYDHDFQAQLAQPGMDVLLQNVYRKQSKLLVVFLCAQYVERDWCGLEWRAVRDLIKSKQSHQIMLLRLDHSPVDGLLSIDGYMDIQNMDAERVADEIVERSKFV